jgi:PIN domain nuclease of toxin-antitoxin system
MADRLLLDTHALIWALADPDQLNPAVRERLFDLSTPVLVSPASIYEITLKVALGKLEAPAADLLATVTQSGFEELPLRLSHANLAGRLPPHHRDPFDRLLIAQALLEHLTLVSRDALLQAYGVQLLVC